LSNIYLHEVLDKWFVETVEKHVNSNNFMVRYADDSIVGFANKSDAVRYMKSLPKRLAKYGLKLHPEKTKLIEFNPYKSGNQKPGTFSFLGFTHYWGKSRKGAWIVKRKTSKKSLTNALIKIREFCKKNRHQNLRVQHKSLVLKLNGHYGYYGITGNGKSLGMYYYELRRIWFKWLNANSQIF